MGVISNIYTISAYILIVHYGTAYADKYCYKSPFDTYECPDDTWCCDADYKRCCSYTNYSSDAIYSFLTAALIAFGIICCCCLLCSCCRRRRNGVVYSSGVTSTVVSLPPQTIPQGYPGYPQTQPPYPTNTGYNPYYGTPPPEYQPTVPNPALTPQVAHVIPVASAPPAM